MKLLLIFESPLARIGGDYYAVDSWMRFALFLASRCERVTLWAPVDVRAAETSPPPDSWRLSLNGLRVEHHDCYRTFVEYCRLWLRRARAWRRHLGAIMDDHDVVCLWHPSPMLRMVARAASRRRKPFMVVLAGDMLSQSDRILAASGAKRLLYRLLVGFWVRKEIRDCRNASMIYAYSRELAARHRSSRAQIKLKRSFSQMSLDDFVYRTDTCQGDQIRVLRACWLIPSKGLEDLLEAVGLVVGRGARVWLDVIGKERVAGYQASLEALASRLGIRDRVSFRGWLPFDRIHEAYVGSDIQVISSLAEGTPRVIFEGAARGLPLVSTSVGGIPLAVRDEHDALLVPPRDPVALAVAIERVIDDGVLRRRLIEHGYANAREASFERDGMEFLADLRSLVARGT